MKRMKYVVLLFGAILFASCGENTNAGADTVPAGETETHEHADGEEPDGHVHSTYYTCTDHQDVHEHESGKCPKCQKDLIAMEEEAHEGHEHHTYYSCSEHTEVHEHEAGKCPKCQKDLIAMEEESHDDHEGREHHSYYTCSEHTDVHEHEAGKCPKCSKDLVEKKE